MPYKQKIKNPVKAYSNAVDKFTDNVILPTVHKADEKHLLLEKSNGSALIKIKNVIITILAVYYSAVIINCIVVFILNFISIKIPNIETLLMQSVDNNISDTVIEVLVGFFGINIYASVFVSPIVIIVTIIILGICRKKDK